MNTNDLKAELVSGLSKQMIEYLLADLRDIAKEKQILADELDRLKAINFDLEEKLRMYRQQSVTIIHEPQRTDHE